MAGSIAVGGRSKTPAEWALLALGLAATVAVTLVVTRIARGALKNVTPGAPE